jgi:hypothetical protein
MMDEGFKASELFGYAETSVEGSEVSFETAAFSCQMVGKNPIATYTYSEKPISTIVLSYATSSVIFSVGRNEIVIVAMLVAVVAVIVTLLRKVTFTRTKGKPSTPLKPITIARPGKPAPVLSTAKIKHCPDCGLVIPLEAKYCPRCGTEQYYFG